MSKITQLPVVANPDGSETAVVVKNGVTQRARLDTLIDGALAPIAAQVVPQGVATVVSKTDDATVYAVALPVYFEPFANGDVVDFIVPETSMGTVSLKVGSGDTLTLFSVRAQPLVAGWSVRIAYNAGGLRWNLVRQLPQGIDLLDVEDIAGGGLAAIGQLIGVPPAIPIRGDVNEFFVDFDGWANDATFEAYIVQTNTSAAPIINLADGRRRAITNCPAGALVAGQIAKFVVSFGIDNVIFRGLRAMPDITDPAPDLWSVLDDTLSHPWGNVLPGADGKPMMTPRRLRIVGRGMSVATDADPEVDRQGAAPIGQAPVAVMGKSIADTFAPALAVKVDNLAHGGHVASQAEAQWEEAMAADPSSVDILADFLGMNDLRAAAYNSGQQSPVFLGNPIYYEAELRRRLDSGVKMVVLATTPHPHVGRLTSGFGGNAMQWPYGKAPPITDDQLVPPYLVTAPRDWTGSGKLVVGDARGAHVNLLIRNIARRLNADPRYRGRVVLLDVEWAWFRYGVEQHGVDALYNAGEDVHPNLLGHQVSYQRVIRQFVAAMRRGLGDQWCFRGEPDDSDPIFAGLVVDAVETAVADAEERLDGYITEAGQARDQALAYAPTTFETTDTNAAGLMVVDHDGRIVAQIPDPRVAALVAQTGQFSQTAIFETTDSSSVLMMLDAAGRVAQSLPVPQRDPALTTVMAQMQTVPVTGVWETLDAKSTLLMLDAGGRVLSSVGSGDIDPAVLAGLAEIAAARGTKGSLSERLADAITLDGVPLDTQYRPRLLRQTHYRLAKRALPVPEATQLVINAIGDSWTHNTSRWIGPYTDVLTAMYGDAGGGWCGFGFLQSGNVAPWSLTTQPSYIQGNPRPATYPTRHFGSAAGTYYSASSPDLAKARMSQAGDVVVQAFPALPVHNGCDLFFIGSADGQVSYEWGAYKGSGSVADSASYTFGGATTIAVQGTVGALQIADIKAGMLAGAGMVRLSWVAGTVDLCGVNLKSAAPGVRVNKLAATGSNIGQWSNAAAGWETGIAVLGAHLSIAMDGTNSQTSGMAPATWGGHLATLVARLRAAVPGHDILIATPSENQRTTNTVPMSAYAREARRRAVLLRFAYLDTQDAFGDPANSTEYGSTGVVPLFAADLIHPDPQTGGRALLAEFLRVTKPF